MTFDNTKPHPYDALSLTELDLYHLLMDYRETKGLDPIPLSLSLTATAGRHAADLLYNVWEAKLTLPAGSSTLHSWSDAPYPADHSNPNLMWEAPQRIGTDYPGYGFEIAAAGQKDIAETMADWKQSSGHNNVIINDEDWSDLTWNAIGIAVTNDPSVDAFNGLVYNVWFGREADPDGAPVIRGSARGETIEGTAFRDHMRGKGGDDTLIASSGRDRIFGGGGDDILSGQRGRDALNGGAGDDVLKGGSGKDTFVFTGRNFGTDTITGYNNDRILIKSRGEAHDTVELAAALSNQAGNAVYDHDGDGINVIVFEGVKIAQLDLSLFDLG